MGRIPIQTQPEYNPPEDALDETALSADMRDRYSLLLDHIERRGPDQFRERMQARTNEQGVCFQGANGRKPFLVDPVPRLIDVEEWAWLEAALAQRAEALEAFIQDAYGEQRMVAMGALPERAISSSQLFDPRLRGVPVDRYLYVYGPDVVRDSDGTLLVLEDNVRTPSGFAYLLAIRAAITEVFPGPLDDVRELDDSLAVLRSALHRASPSDEEDPCAVLLTDGPKSPAFYEHCELARRLGIDAATLDDVEIAGDELVRRGDDGSRRRVDVVYRRTDEARFSERDGRLTCLGEKLGPAVGSGKLGLLNAFGTGVADDKLTHAYGEELVRLYLGQEPLIRSVRTLDPGDDEQREEMLERVDELVVKERNRAGGEGVIIEPAEEIGVEDMRRAIEDRDGALIAQERVSISTHPTVCGEEFEPRRVDLRPFLVRTENGWEALPGGLTRFASSTDTLVVNTTQGGGGKDTWVIR